jgi:prepilin-type N-terminal cleavage/methylation domain-containing protein
MARIRGYTLAELLAALAVAGSLALAATPGLASLNADLRRTAALTELLSALEAARRLAASGGSPVTVCVMGPLARCARAGGGFSVFPSGPASPARLQRSLAPTQTLSLNRDNLVFAVGGRSATPATITLCDRLAPGAGRAIIVSRSARARVSEQDPAGDAVACPASGH